MLQCDSTKIHQADGAYGTADDGHGTGSTTMGTKENDKPNTRNEIEEEKVMNNWQNDVIVERDINERFANPYEAEEVDVFPAITQINRMLSDLYECEEHIYKASDLLHGTPYEDKLMSLLDDLEKIEGALTGAKMELGGAFV